MRRITKSEALQALIGQALDLKLRGVPGVDMLVRVVRNADCYSINTNRLEESAHLIEGLMR